MENSTLKTSTTSLNKKSKKITVTLCVITVLVAGWIGAAWYSGKKIENIQQKYMTAINQNIVPQLNKLLAKKLNELASVAFTINGDTIEPIEYDAFEQIEIVLQDDYQRGIFSSTGRYLIQNKKHPAQQVMLEANIHHGPFPVFSLLPKMASIELTLQKTPYVESLFKLTADKTPFILTATPSYGRDIQMNLVVNPINISDEDSELTYSGAVINLENSDNIVDLQIDSGVLHLSLDDLNVDISDITASIETDTSQFEKYGMITGKQRYMIKRILFARLFNRETDSLPLKIELNDLDLSFENHIKEQLPYQSVTMILANLKVNDKDFGSSRIMWHLDKFDIVALQDLIKHLQTTIHDQKSIVPLIRKLLTTEPTIRLAPLLSWKNSKGESTINLNLNLQISPDELPSDIDPDDLALYFIFKAIKNLDADFSISPEMATELLTNIAIVVNGFSEEEALAQANNQIAIATILGLSKNIITKKDNNIISQLKYANNELTLNGDRHPLPFSSDELDD